MTGQLPVAVTCPACQQRATLPASEVAVVVCSHATRATYLCPTCRTQVSKDLDSQQAKLLIDNHVRLFVVHVDATPLGPPLTEDDLIAFGLELEALR